MKILVAGGAGYIGTHTCISLLQSQHDVIVVDSLVNSRIENLRRVQEICARPIDFIEADIRDRNALDRIFAEHRPDAVINFAGHKAVGDSVARPLDYYDNNLNCAMALLECMSCHGVKAMVFSSSAAVYGEPRELPLSEQAATEPQSPYGRTKLMIEQVMTDLSRADELWKFVVLRYFNPVGAHPSGLIGEQPTAEPSNLLPVLIRVAAGEQSRLNIFGNDYDTRDGTSIRDYIHIMDLAGGHDKAIQRLETQSEGGLLTVNLGTGNGYSVLEMLRAFEQSCGRQLPYKFDDRRPGDVASCYADATLAKHELGWEAGLGIDDMCRDAWNWKTCCGR